MISAHLGIKRDGRKTAWVKCAELNVLPSGEVRLSVTALRCGLLQGRAFDGALSPYLDGDIFIKDQWIGFMMTSETGTGVWYTAVIELIPVMIPSPSGIVVMEIR